MSRELNNPDFKTFGVRSQDFCSDIPHFYPEFTCSEFIEGLKDTLFFGLSSTKGIFSQSQNALCNMNSKFLLYF